MVDRTNTLLRQKSFFRYPRAISFFLIICGAVTWIAAVDDDSPKLKLETLKVRSAALLPHYVVMRRAIDLMNALPTEKKAKLLKSIDDLVERERTVIGDVEKHPDGADNAVKQLQEDRKKTETEAFSSLEVDQKTEIQKMYKVVSYESLLFTADWSQLHRPDPLPGIVEKLRLTDDQTKALADVKDKATKQKDAVLDDQMKANELASGDDTVNDPHLWIQENIAIGTQAAEDFLKSLTPDQVKIWNAEVLSHSPAGK